MITRILPLINRLVPKGIALKGLSKVDPRLGKFINAATTMGFTADQAIDYIRQQTSTSDNKGLRPDELAANKRVKQGNEIPGLIQKAATTGLGLAGASAIPEVLGNLFQNEESENQENKKPMSLQEAERIVALNKFNEKKRKSSLLEQERERFNQQYMPQEENQQISQNQSNTDQALLAALEKILQM